MGVFDLDYDAFAWKKKKADAEKWGLIYDSK